MDKDGGETGCNWCLTGDFLQENAHQYRYKSCREISIDSILSKNAHAQAGMNQLLVGKSYGNSREYDNNYFINSNKPL